MDLEAWDTLPHHTDEATPSRMITGPIIDQTENSFGLVRSMRFEITDGHHEGNDDRMYFRESMPVFRYSVLMLIS